MAVPPYLCYLCNLWLVLASGVSMRIEDVVIVLVRPKVAGNIGSAARGMKVMGCGELRLVGLQTDHLGDDARRFAYGSEDVLEAARVFDDLPSALADCNIRAATTHRMGRRREVDKTLQEYAAEAAGLPDGTRLGLVFGSEEYGLSNEELKACHFALAIPQAVEYPSLNLAQAVVVTCAEFFARLTAQKKRRQPKLAAVEDIEDLHTLAASALKVLGYRDVPDRNLYTALLRTLKRVLARAALRPGEARSFHGIFRRIEQLAEKQGPRLDEE